MLKEPLVSIVIPCYNHEPFIVDAIKSIINQRYSNIELIVIDDGSIDDSVEAIYSIAHECEERFSRFKLISRANKGVSATLNEGISLSKGEIIGFCSSDDTLHQNKVLEQVRFFSKNKKYKFCFTKAYVQDDTGKVLDGQTQLINKNLQDDISFTDVLNFKVHLPVTGMYLAKFLKEDLKGFDERLSAEDYDINLRILERTSAGFVDEYLYFYRSPSAIGSDRNRKAMRRDVSESHLQTINKYRDHPQYKNALNEWNFRRFIYFSSYREDKIYAIKGMIKSVNKISSIYYMKALIRLCLFWK